MLKVISTEASYSQVHRSGRHKATASSLHSHGGPRLAFPTSVLSEKSFPISKLLLNTIMFAQDISEVSWGSINLSFHLVNSQE